MDVALSDDSISPGLPRDRTHRTIVPTSKNREPRPPILFTHLLRDRERQENHDDEAAHRERRSDQVRPDRTRTDGTHRPVAELAVIRVARRLLSVPAG